MFFENFPVKIPRKISAKSNNMLTTTHPYSRKYRLVINYITVFDAEVGGINKVKPPSMHSRLRNRVAGLGAR